MYLNVICIAGCEFPEACLLKDLREEMSSKKTLGVVAGDVKNKASRLKTAVLSRMKPKSVDTSSPATSASFLETETSESFSRKTEKCSPSEHEPSEDDTQDTLAEGESQSQIAMPNSSLNGQSPAIDLDPKVTGAVVLCSILVLWRPSIFVVALLLLGNLLLGFVVVALCMHLRRREAGSGRAVASADQTNLEADVKATIGLQQLLSPGWTRMRGIVAQRDFQGVVTAIDLGEEVPEVTFVRSVEAPCEDVVCFNVGLHLAADAESKKTMPTVEMEVKLPGYSIPWTFRLKLLALDVTVQLYFWSWPPEGWGSGRPYSLIEGALCPEASNPPAVRVALEAITKSSLLEQFLSGCETVASAVICSRVLPRFTGFQNRVILEEGHASAPNQKTKDSADWQKKARRAGWQPRAEAAVESVGTSCQS